jgi:hypothetical protein
MTLPHFHFSMVTYWSHTNDLGVLIRFPFVDTGTQQKQSVGEKENIARPLGERPIEAYHGKQRDNFFRSLTAKRRGFSSHVHSTATPPNSLK